MTRRILLVEDEPLSQDIIISLLRGQGYAVDVATDGFAALDRARTVRYDVALIDYHLPEMDGYALGRLLREQHPGSAAGPVLIGLTADRNGLAARRGSDAVFRAILPKPIKPADLFSTIERFCEAAAPAAVPAVAGVAEPDDPRRAAAALWRSHGLALPPKAFASPPPSGEQAAALALCFELVEADAAQCILLLERHGINEALRSAARGRERALPIFGLSPDHADICDGLFRVDDAASWRTLADAIGPRPTMEPVAPPEPVQLRVPAHDIVVAFSPAAAAESAADVTPPAPAADRPASSDGIRDLRQLLLGGIRTPLDALRHDLARLDDAGGHRDRTALLAAVDSMLLVAGAIADALAAPRASEGAPTSFDPAEMSENAVAMIRDTLPAGQASLACRIEPGVPQRLRGDAHRLSQVVLTLLDDACTQAGAAAIQLILGFDAARGRLTLGLSQTGSPTPGDGEAGVVALLRNLRLTTLTRLVELMGGTLTRQGGTVQLDIPAEAETAAARRDIGAPAHILLIEDGTTGSQGPTLQLMQGGHKVCRVADGEAALFACRSASHDLIVVDLADDPSVRRKSLAALKRLEAHATGVPLLVLGDPTVQREAGQHVEASTAHVLPKPYTPDAFEQAIAACRAVPGGQNAVEIVDRRVRDALVEMLGAPSVERLTGQLMAHVETLIDGPSLSADARARLLELSGSAGILGLAELAAACAEPKEGAALAAALSRLRQTFDGRRSSAA
jgi:CheY-like chemotaxis protein